MSHQHEKPRRCGWVAIGLVLFLIQGILPGSLLGGVAGLKSADMVFGHHMGSAFMNRLLVLGGMIAVLMVSAIVIMTLTLAVSGIAAGFLKRSSLTAPKEEPSLEK